MAVTAQDLVRFDRDRSADGTLRIAGVDEAGRGCWAGPVVAAAVILPAGWCPAGLDDSKRLSPQRRERLWAEIRAEAVSWCACSISAATIDSINILQATLSAMARAVGRLCPPPDYVLVDGLQLPDLNIPAEPLIRGDGRSAAVAAASIVAKVLRDRVMRGWDRFHPGYGFAEHKGYGSTAHRQALLRLGPCPLHRRSYRPVANLMQESIWNESR